MDAELRGKELALANNLEKIPSCVIAFSGGLDSIFLAAIAKTKVPGRTVCATVVDPSTPDCDIQSAKTAASRQGLEHIIIISGIHPDVRRNSPERCYICKSQIFQKLEEIREREGLAKILDGENASDSGDDRPGSRAARECGIISPLADAHLTKQDIRMLAKSAGISEWDRPASACLSSRIPYGTEIVDDTLRKIDATEQFIRSKGIRMIRARAEGNGTRLELGQDENTEKNQAMLEALFREIKSFGWASVKIDPAGYIPAGLRSRNNGK